MRKVRILGIAPYRGLIHLIESVRSPLSGHRVERHAGKYGGGAGAGKEILFWI